MGQNPVWGLITRGRAGTGSISSTPVDISMPNFFESLIMHSSLSFVPSPFSNIDMADCLQPTSAANSSWEIFASRRASFILRQNSGLRFVTGGYYGLYFINLQGGSYQHYQQIYQLMNTCSLLCLYLLLILSIGPLENFGGKEVVFTVLIRNSEAIQLFYHWAG